MPLSPEDRGRLGGLAASARMTPDHRRRRARVAAMSRHHPGEPDLATDDRRDLKADAAERYVRELVDNWPPLTDQQRGRLAALLTGAGEADASPAPE